MAQSLEQLKMEKDRQVSELNAELSTTRQNHTLTESFFWQFKLLSDSIPLSFHTGFRIRFFFGNSSFVSLENFCGVRFYPFAPFTNPGTGTCTTSVANL
jgi:hypothetical protein